MSNLIISLNEFFFNSKQKINEDRSKVETLAQTTQTIWNRIHKNPICSFVKIIHIFRNTIGSIVRDAFFFPLKWPLITNIQTVKDQLDIEETYSKNFWDSSKPLDPNLKLHEQIREKFDPPQDRVFPIKLKNGQVKEITYRIIQTKEKGENCYNFVQLPGIYATISNNIVGIHPYLAAYLNFEKEGKPLPPARFIIISENNLNFKPTTLEEAGFVILETLKALQAEFGELDQLVAHSLGTIFLANMLNQIDDPKILPKHICFDRGPTSIWEASKKYFFGFGRLIYFLANYGGWASNTEQNIADFCTKWKERPSLLITGVIQDHHFSGGANLCLGKKIKKSENVEILVFNPPRQIAHQQAQHNLSPDFFNPCYLTQNSDFIKPSENLPEAIIRHSIRCST